MDTSKEKTGAYYSVPEESLEVNHGYTGAADLEVVPPNAPELHKRHTEADQKIPYMVDGRRPERRRICGVTPLIFWIMIFALVIILSAGLGGGLGAGLSHKNSSDNPTTIQQATSSSPTPTPSREADHTTTPIAPARATSSASPDSEDVTCPENDTLVYTPPSNTASSTAYYVNDTTLTYTIHCNKSYPQSVDIYDLQYIKNSNLSSCIQSCSIWNVQYPNGGGENGFYNLCSGLTVTEDNTCQLKGGVELNAAGVNKTGGRGQSAILLW